MLILSTIEDNELKLQYIDIDISFHRKLFLNLFGEICSI